MIIDVNFIGISLNTVFSIGLRSGNFFGLSNNEVFHSKISFFIDLVVRHFATIPLVGATISVLGHFKTTLDLSYLHISSLHIS